MTVFFIMIATIIQSQPAQSSVSFSHKTHADTFSIACRFCHYYPDRSPSAGMPSLFDCQGCHAFIKGSDDKMRTEIDKLDQLWRTETPLVWSKRNDLPDFVFFSHQSHARVGVECETCHGDVMKQEQEAAAGLIDPLDMGWCVDCHKEQHLVSPRFDLVLASRQEEAVQHAIRGSTDCQSCHH